MIVTASTMMMTIMIEMMTMTMTMMIMLQICQRNKPERFVSFSALLVGLTSITQSSSLSHLQQMRDEDGPSLPGPLHPLPPSSTPLLYLLLYLLYLLLYLLYLL